MGSKYSCIKMDTLKLQKSLFPQQKESLKVSQFEEDFIDSCINNDSGLHINFGYYGNFYYSNNSSSFNNQMEQETRFIELIPELEKLTLNNKSENVLGFRENKGRHELDNIPNFEFFLVPNENAKDLEEDRQKYYTESTEDEVEIFKFNASDQ